MTSPTAIVQFLTPVLFLLPSIEAFDLSECHRKIQTLISQNTTLINDSTIFSQIPANPANPLLLLRACEEICGDEDKTIYRDCGMRLFQWVLPAVILSGSVQLPSLTWWQRVCARLRMVGDPIDSLSSMIYELDLCEQCYEEAGNLIDRLTGQLNERDGDEDKIKKRALRKCLALILRTIMALEQSIDLVSLNDALISMTSLLPDRISRPKDGEHAPQPLTRAEFEMLILETGGTLFKIRTWSMLKSCHAIFWFVTGIIVAIIPEVAGSTSSGAMIASSLVLSPLLLMVFLSNSIGFYASQELLGQQVRNFLSRLPQNNDETDVRNLTGRLQNTFWFDDSTVFNGMPIYQSRKFWAKTAKRGRIRHRFLIFTLLLSPIQATVAAGIALGAPPAYFNDRIFLIITIFGLWVLSFFITLCANNRNCWDLESRKKKERLGWRCFLIVVIKDVVIGITIPIFSAGMTCGWLGGCKMWSGYYRYGWPASIPLNPVDAFHRNGHVLYPILVGLVFGLNILAFICVRCVFTKVFDSLIWTKEEEKLFVQMMKTRRSVPPEPARLRQCHSAPNLAGSAHGKIYSIR
jgi:hypothetical protein